MRKEADHGFPGGQKEAGVGSASMHCLCVLLTCALLALSFVRTERAFAQSADVPEFRVEPGRVFLPARPQTQHFDINSALRYWVEPSGEASLQQVLANAQWQDNSAGAILNFGFTRKHLWAQLDLILPSHGLQEDWNLVVPYALLENLTLYVIDPHTGNILASLDHHQVRPSPSQIDSYYIHFPLQSGLRGEMVLVLNASSTTSLQMPVELWSQTYLVQRQVLETLFWGVYFGIILALMAYNGFLFLSVRDMTYLFYVLYLGAMVGLMLCISGLGAFYLWSSLPEVTHYALPIFTGLASAFALFFARSFLHWRGFPARLDRSMAFAAVLSAALVVYAGFDPMHGAQLSSWVSSLTISLNIVASIFALLAGVVIARYFALAWTVFALGASLYLLNVFGLIPVTRFSNHAIQVGSALEAVLLSFALAHRIKEDRALKLKALQQQHHAEQQMQQLQVQALEHAMHDPVTRLPNESLLVTRLQELIQNAERPYPSFALVVMHFPQMKEIATSLGRGMAEALFRAVIRDLSHILQEENQAIAVELHTHAYLAAPEFGSLAFLCAQGEGYENLEGFVTRLMTQYETAMDVGAIAINLETYSGIAVYPDHGDRPDILVQHAHAARDFGVRSGNRVMLYNADIDAYGRRRLALMGALSRAIREGELELYLQPQLDCNGLRLVGAETLLRWHSERHGQVPPQEFIEIAESSGLMNNLTRYVVSRAISQLRVLHQHGLQLSMSINLSVQNLIEPDFVQYVVDTARSHQIEMHHLVLEVTETSLIENITTVVENLQKLADAGCSIALDDFGTGYSSLAYLSRLPIHELKIDRSFIRQMSENTSDLRIVENTVKLARTLSIQTVAEGIEDSSMLDTVTQLGCDRVQGYHLGRPMPLQQFHDWAMRLAS